MVEKSQKDAQCRRHVSASVNLGYQQQEVQMVLGWERSGAVH